MPNHKSCNVGELTADDSNCLEEATICSEIPQQLFPNQIDDLYGVRATLLPSKRKPRYYGAPGLDFTACWFEQGSAHDRPAELGFVPSIDL